MGTDGVTVYPLSFGCITTIPKHFEDLPAVDVGVTILRQATLKPANPSGARDRVEPQGPDAGGVVAVDGESHRVVCVVCIVGLGVTIATPCVPLDQLVSDCPHNVAILAHNVTEGVANVSVGIGLVMHGKTDIHGTIQIGRGFGLAQSGAGDGEIVHATIIGTGSDALGSIGDTLPTVTSISYTNSCNA